MGKRIELDRDQEDYWDKRKRRGRPKALKSPDHLWSLACDYFKRRDKQKIVKKEFIRGGERAGEVVDLEQMVPYTWQGFEAYLHERKIIAHLRDYRANKGNYYDDYSEILIVIGHIMYDQKFTGAASGAFNANVIIRDLGLSERTEMLIQQEQPLFGDTDEEEND